jgi:hypothetical protein
VKSVTSRRLQVERLESRLTCAGNVTAAIVSGSLIITGDDSPNRITVESAGVGRIQVRGFGTAINGFSNGLRYFDGVTGGVEIRTRGGDDLVRVTNVILPGKLLVDLGDGNDEAVIGHDRPVGDSRFANTPTGHVAVYGDLRVIGGEGNDLLHQSYVHAKKLTTFDMGGGNDRIQMEQFPGEGQDDKFRGALNILPGAGDDQLDLSDVVAEAGVTINDPAGVNRISLTNFQALASLTAQLGVHADQVQLTNVSAVRLEVQCNGDNDTVTLKSVTATDAIFGGGNGDDLYQDSLVATNRFGTLTRSGFERVEHSA